MSVFNFWYYFVVGVDCGVGGFLGCCYVNNLYFWGGFDVWVGIMDVYVGEGDLWKWWCNELSGSGYS